VIDWEGLLGQAAHRPWPLPAARWRVRMSWARLLFAHWSLPPEALAPRLPPGLALDTHEGRAFLGLVPFCMEHVSLRGLPDVPGLSTFPEVNLRTYVTAGGKPGVWFFSLDAHQALAVAAARATFGLPYFRARMTARPEGETTVYASERAHPGSPAARFAGRYRPTGTPFEPRVGSLEHWLTERYCLYAVRRGRLVRGEIHHPPWRLQPAALTLETESLAAAAGVPSPPAEALLLHYAARQDALAWPPTAV